MYIYVDDVQGLAVNQEIRHLPHELWPLLFFYPHDSEVVTGELRCRFFFKEEGCNASFWLF